MSLYRTVVRLAAVHALNNYMQAPFPTLAGPNIFDSKIEPVEEMKFDRVFPCVVVYTDYDKDHWRFGTMPHKDRLMTVTIELLVVHAKKTAGSGTVFQLAYPETDNEIESTLDALEAQIEEALSTDSVACNALHTICHAFVAGISRRGASIEGGRRLAARQLTLEFKALRESPKGIIPPAVATFLERLAEHADYADRVPDIRALLTSRASASDLVQKISGFGYSRDTALILGASPDGITLLPANITYNLTGV